MESMSSVSAGTATIPPWPGLWVALAAAGFVLAASLHGCILSTGASRLARSGAGRACVWDWATANRGCATVVHTPGARLFGPPNSLLGMMFYTALLVFAGLGFPARLLMALVLAATWATVAVGAYLGYRLLYVERMRCPVCWTVAHASMPLLATGSYCGFGVAGGSRRPEKSTLGATLADSGTWNSGYSLNPKMLAVMLAGNDRRDVLYCWTRSL